MHTIKIRGVIQKDDTIFILRDPEKNFYYLPGGTLESYETFQECLSREIQEELGVIPDIGEVVYIREFWTKNGLYLDIWFRIHNASDFDYINKEKITHGYEYCDEGWYAWNDLIGKDVRPKNLQEILECQNKIDFLPLS